MNGLDQKRQQLLDRLRSMGRVAVAFSGGVDSAVVAQAAFLAVGARAVAVTGTSASLAAGELDLARQVAQQIGIRHEILQTDEFASESYTRNAPDRCFHCKTELYDQIERRRDRWQFDTIVNGANLDDLGDYRPGMQAARQHEVRSPLAECEITKDEVRQLARQWQLPVWDKPASPCLSSRVAYGQQVSPERLSMIDRAEQYLRGLGIQPVRVRYHADDTARIEVSVDALATLTSDTFRRELVDHLRTLGFRFVTLDLEGFRSGSLNTLISADQLRSLQ